MTLVFLLPAKRIRVLPRKPGELISPIGAEKACLEEAHAFAKARRETLHNEATAQHKIDANKPTSDLVGVRSGLMEREEALHCSCDLS